MASPWQPRKQTTPNRKTEVFVQTKQVCKYSNNIIQLKFILVSSSGSGSIFKAGNRVFIRFNFSREALALASRLDFRCFGDPCGLRTLTPDLKGVTNALALGCLTSFSCLSFFFSLFFFSSSSFAGSTSFSCLCFFLLPSFSISGFSGFFFSFGFGISANSFSSTPFLDLPFPPLPFPPRPLPASCFSAFSLLICALTAACCATSVFKSSGVAPFVATEGGKGSGSGIVGFSA